MKKLQIFSLLICGYILNTCWAMAPVVDESENFAISSPAEPDLQQPLAHDDSPTIKVTNNNQIAQLLNQLQELQQAVQELRGQIENQNHSIETLKKQQLTLYKDLDDRIQGGSKAAKTNEPQKLVPAVQNSKPKNPAEEQVAYMAAYQFIDQHEFSKASLALQEFVKKYPQSAYAPNAEYWLGEVLLQENNYAAAMAHFENVVNNFPGSNKHAAALYKLGVSLAQNGQNDDARTKYLALIQQYPDSDTAKLAQNQLKRL